MFDAVKTKNEIVEFIRDYYKKANAKGAILGISGGKDSGVVAALMVEALGKENVIGITMPCHSKEEDKNLAKLVSDYYGFELLNFDLTKIFDDIKEELKSVGDFTDDETKNSDINVKPRLRMMTVYYLAALMSKVKGGTYLTVGTSNKCELFVGYFTKGGDSVHDIAPIADLTVEEVIKVGEVLNVPPEVLYKTPDDGLSNQTDEEKLGVKYSEIAQYMDDETKLDDDTRAKIKKLHDGSRHKFNIPKYEKNIGG
ncbi:MAG: NAD(+) synthase [Clostridia bacterium]|nr:NAD(+) synthase [Clostridia bacterium]